MSNVWKFKATEKDESTRLTRERKGYIVILDYSAEGTVSFVAWYAFSAVARA